MLKKIISLGLLAVVLPLSLFAETVPMSMNDAVFFLTRDQRTELQEKGELTEFHFGDFDPLLLPAVPMEDKIRDAAVDGGLNMGIECLFYFKDYDMESFRQNPEKAMLELYNGMREVQTLEGIQYYSASRGEMRDFFVESWVIPSLEEKRTKLEDPLVTSIPARDSFLIHQKDLSFGRYESEMSFFHEDPVVWCQIVNQTSMYYKGFLRVIKPEKMQIHLLVIPTDEGILFYGITAADTLNIKAFREKANNSFYNRVKAMYAWYAAKF